MFAMSILLYLYNQQQHQQQKKQKKGIYDLWNSDKRAQSSVGHHRPDGQHSAGDDGQATDFSTSLIIYASFPV